MRLYRGCCLGGFSLIEVLAVLVCLLVLSTAFTVGFERLVNHQQVNNVATRLLVFLRHARGYAVLHRTVVTVCGSRDAVNCDGNWSSHVLLLSNHRVLKTISIDQSVRLGIVWKGGFGSRHCLKFDAHGFAMGFQGRFRIFNFAHTRSRYLVVSPSGLLR